MPGLGRYDRRSATSGAAWQGARGGPCAQDVLARRFLLAGRSRSLKDAGVRKICDDKVWRS